MLFIADKNSIQAHTKWKITNKDILNGKKKLTYFSPGGYSIKDTQDRIICFDWCDSLGNYEEENQSIIESAQYSFDYDHINASLEEDGYNELIKKEHRLELFKDFKEMEEIFCVIDIDNEEVPFEGNIECIYFELYDPISNERVMLIGEYDGE